MKLLARLVLGVVILTALVGFVLSLSRLRPSTPLIVGPTTTWITEPLTEDGLPDYVGAIEMRRGVGTPSEENGAVEFWQAIGPFDLDSGDFSLLCEEIGLNWPDEHLEPLKSDANVRRLTEDLKTRFGDEVRFCGAENMARDVADDMLRACVRFPWNDEDLPTVASWLKENDRHLEGLKKAFAKPKFYSPSVSHLRDPDAAVVETLLTHCSAARMAASAFAARAMYRTHEGALDQAIDDCEAILELSKCAGGVSLVETLVSGGIRNTAYDCLAAILGDSRCQVRHASRCRNLLDAIEPIDIAEAINFGERLMYLDYALRLTTGREISAESGVGLDIPAAAMRRAVNPNIPLELGNEFYDMLANAANAKDPERRQLLQQVDAKIRALHPSVQEKAMSFLSRDIRSRTIGKLFGQLLLPATSSAVTVMRRDDSIRHMTWLAASLRTYELQNQEFPESLSQLGRELVDAKHEKRSAKLLVHYRRMGEGFMLFAPGMDEELSSGNNARAGQSVLVVLNGKWTNREDVLSGNDAMAMQGELAEVENPLGDDWTILIPGPDVAWGATPEDTVSPRHASD